MQDVPGFCRSVKLEEIREHGYVLTPGRYVGAEPWKMTTSICREDGAANAQLAEQMAKGSGVG